MHLRVRAPTDMQQQMNARLRESHLLAPCGDFAQPSLCLFLHMNCVELASRWWPEKGSQELAFTQPIGVKFAPMRMLRMEMPCQGNEGPRGQRSRSNGSSGGQRRLPEPQKMVETVHEVNVEIQRCQKGRGIGCVIPRCNLKRRITQL